MTIDDSHQLADIRRTIEAAENAGDPAAIVDLLAEDAVLIVPDFPVQEGKAACSAFLQDLLPGLIAAFDRRVTYTSAEARMIGDAALDRGAFVFTVRPRHGRGLVERVTGKYLWLFKRDRAGAWKCVHMMASRDEAAAAPERPLEGRDRSLRFVAALALGFAVFLAVAEIAWNWGDWSFWPFWIVDYIAVGLLLTGWRAARTGGARASTLLAGAWGFTCAMFYMAFFLHAAGVGASDRMGIAAPFFTAAIGLLFGVTVIGFAGSMVGVRQSHDAAR